MANDPIRTASGGTAPPETTITNDPKRTVRRPRGTSVTPQYGRRVMKWYPIHEGELNFLAVTEGLAAILFAIASACITFALDLTKDFAMSANVPMSVAVTWGGYKTAAWIIGVAALVAGVGLSVWRWIKVERIKGDTTFD